MIRKEVMETLNQFEKYIPKKEFAMSMKKLQIGFCNGCNKYGVLGGIAGECMLCGYKDIE